MSDNEKNDHGTHDRQTAGFVAAREARQAELAEDYVELIDDLITETGEARVVDLAQRLGVSHATVVKTVKRLSAEGLVVSRPYRSLFLSDEGRRLADRSRARHAVVRDVLVALGVSDATADIDAEGIEHHVSEETLDAMRRFLQQGGRRE